MRKNKFLALILCVFMFGPAMYAQDVYGSEPNQTDATEVADSDDQNQAGDENSEKEEPEDDATDDVLWPASMVSGTLPVIYINTEGSVPVLTKDYIDAYYWFDPMNTDFEAFGSEDKPLKTEIKGRGNYTWEKYEKKPYKLKFDKKAALLGLPKSKHWALLADANSSTIYTTALAQEISRKMGLAWTPSCYPVEVVLNGEYIGFYTLCETVRVDEGRVNIFEQPDEATDPEVVSGAWLVEIDNTKSDYQVTFDDGTGKTMAVTADTPEVLSAEQTAYLSEQMQLITSLIFAEDKSDMTDLANIIDLNSLARFYLVLELIDDQEAFSGSCFFFKSDEPGAKWTFGPIWDLGNALTRVKENRRLFESTFNNHWIQELVKFPDFRLELMDVWEEFKAQNPAEYFSQYVADYMEFITPAYTGPDSERWPDLNIPLSWYKKQVPGRIADNYNTLDAWYRKLPEFYVYAPCLLEGVSVEDGQEEEWEIIGEFVGQPDCSYVAELPYLPKNFKISSAEGDFALGIPEEGDNLQNFSSCTIDEIAVPFNIDANYKNAVLTYQPAHKTLALEGDEVDSSKIQDMVADGADETTIFDLQGRSVNRKASLTPGIYIVKEGTSTSKLIIR